MVMAFEVFQTSLLEDQANPWTELMVDVCDSFRLLCWKFQAKPWTELMVDACDSFRLLS